MNIPFANFSTSAQIPLSPAFILKIKESLDQLDHYDYSQPKIIIKLSESVIAKIFKDYNTETVEIFEYADSPYGGMFKFGKIDAYSTTSLQTGTCFTDVFQGNFKTYILKGQQTVLIEEGNYVLGHLNGEHKYYLDDIIEITTYLNDIKNGPYSIAKADGTKVLEGEYCNDQREGKWLLYYPTGTIKKIVNYCYKVGGEYGLTQEFNEQGQLISSFGKLLEALHGPQTLNGGKTYAYYLFNIVVEKEVYDKYSFEKQDEIMSNTNRYFLEEYLNDNK